ncbi:hypothetical protein SNEBB_009228 [Seison nebaliae]|nr:hypothetical protein SNEBB_009228 [Seison nebaliae]
MSKESYPPNIYKNKITNKLGKDKCFTDNEEDEEEEDDDDDNSPKSRKEYRYLSNSSSQYNLPLFACCIPKPFFLKSVNKPQLQKSQTYQIISSSNTISIGCDPIKLPNLDSFSVSHITDIYLNDDDLVKGTNPVDKPLDEPLFFRKLKNFDSLKSKNKHLILKNRINFNKLERLPSSSTSTIFVDENSVSLPNMRTLLICVSIAIQSHIEKDKLWKPSNLLSTTLMMNIDENYDIFDERIHPLHVNTSCSNNGKYYIPTGNTIYYFLVLLFENAQLTPECGIVTLVYLERLLLYTTVRLTQFNWRRILLASVLLASKVWEDQAVWNVDFCQIVRNLTVPNMNEMERFYLEAIQFNIDVPSSVYAKYYFDLRHVAILNSLCRPTYPLTNQRAIELELVSNYCELKYQLVQKRIHRRSNSENLKKVPEKNFIIN